MERCPRCGTRADAVAVTHHVPPGKKRALAEHLDVVRRELGLRSEGEALAAAVRRAALDLNQGGRIGSADAGHTARTIRPRRNDVGEQEQEGQPVDAEQQPVDEAQQQDDGGATAGTTGTEAEQATEGGDEQAVDAVQPSEGDDASGGGEGDEPSEPQE